MKKYEVSLEKYISNPNNSNLTPDRSGKAEYLTIENGVYKDNTKNDTQWTQHNTTKYDNPVTVSTNSEITYTIKVRNDGNTKVYIPSVTDKLPTDVDMFNVLSAYKYSYNAETNSYANKIITAEVDTINSTDNTKIIKIDESMRVRENMLKPQDYILINIKVRTRAKNSSLEIYKNTANITENKVVNKNNIELTDKTPYNN